MDSVQDGCGRKASWAGRRVVFGTSGKWVKNLGLRALPLMAEEEEEEEEEGGKRLRRAGCSGAVAVADEMVVEDA